MLLDLLGYAGNALDLPGSSVRDLLTGNNPFDQWATPFSDQNRASGRDVLAPLLGANQATGIGGWFENPMEGIKDVLGFGAEMVLDPTNIVGSGIVRGLAKSRKAIEAAERTAKLREAGKYGYVNARVLADKVLNPMSEAAPTQKLLGYTPERPQLFVDGRGMSAPTPDYPYGRFDLGSQPEVNPVQIEGPGMQASGSRYGLEDAESVYQMDVPEEALRGFIDANAPLMVQPNGVLALLEQAGMNPRAKELLDQVEGLHGQLRQLSDRWKQTGSEADYDAFKEVQGWMDSLLGAEVTRAGDTVHNLRNMTGSDVADVMRPGSTFQRMPLSQASRLREFGVPGISVDAAGRGYRDYAIWDQDIIDQMRVRGIDGERVPINPTTTVVSREAPRPQAPPTREDMIQTIVNPMAPQVAANPEVTAGVLYNLLARQNSLGGLQ